MQILTRQILSQKDNEGRVIVNVAVTPQTPTQKRILDYAIKGMQDFSGGSNYDLTATIESMEYRRIFGSWRVYVKRDYMLREGGDVNKFPGETFRPVLMQIDMIIHSERGLLMFANGPYRSYQTEYQAQALKRERGY